MMDMESISKMYQFLQEEADVIISGQMGCNESNIEKLLVLKIHRQLWYALDEYNQHQDFWACAIDSIEMVLDYSDQLNLIKAKKEYKYDDWKDVDLGPHKTESENMDMWNVGDANYGASYYFFREKYAKELASFIKERLKGA